MRELGREGGREEVTFTKGERSMEGVKFNRSGAEENNYVGIRHDIGAISQPN